MRRTAAVVLFAAILSTGVMPAHAAGSTMDAAPVAVRPMLTWDQIKGRSLEDVVELMPTALRQETQSNPFYPMLKNLKMESLPGFLQDHIRNAMTLTS
ncbi:hypothetical protein ACFP1Z_11675 [Streptomyces gamaensis]|uniref:Uncharacterized protein n=1 Tax=Streptomyces gamaensis TaxID=1763542 RepID=A0ABW0Z358_9ACTN